MKWKSIGRIVCYVEIAFGAPVVGALLALLVSVVSLLGSRENSCPLLFQGDDSTRAGPTAGRCFAISRSRFAISSNRRHLTLADSQPRRRAYPFSTALTRPALRSARFSSSDRENPASRRSPRSSQLPSDCSSSGRSIRGGSLCMPQSFVENIRKRKRYRSFWAAAVV
jgi:hypothetical protein